MRLQSLILFVAICALALVDRPANCGTISPVLDAAYQEAGEQAKLPVLIALTRQADLSSLGTRYPLGNEVQTADRHTVLVDSLQAVSKRSQAEVQASISILERNSMAEAVEYLWIANLIKANVSRAGAELIANFETVNEIGLDEKITLFNANGSAAESKLLHTEAALMNMNARDILSSGVTGAGTVVGVVGTPFESAHPMFARRELGGNTLIMSSICGDATAMMLGAAIGCDKQKGDTIGVAPDANWRLIPLVCGRDLFLSDVLRSLQESQLGSFDEVPDVILQAWQLGDSCTSGVPQLAWRAFSNIEELGSVLIWAAGDNGEMGRGSIGLPAALTGSEQTFFSVGALQADGKTILPQSSRGPSPCDHKTIKPELTAIGATRTANSNGLVSTQSSLCAAGYAAGTVALMRQVNPMITASAAKIALQLSARNLGVAGEDNDYGYGALDVNAAVVSAASSSENGTISGTVRYGGERVAGARVFLVAAGGSYTAVSNSEGQFRFTQIPAERKFALYVARFGYKDFTAPDSVWTSKQKDFSVGVDLDRGIADDVEVDRGFIFGVADDNATAGLWSRAVPVGSSENGAPVQVAEDATSYGSFCFVTGNGGTTAETAATNDVDGGKTTLRSPMFRLDNLADAKLRFKYAYSNDRGPQKGGDFFRVQISNDAGETWNNLIQSSVSTDGWQDATFKIEDFVTLSDKMIVQFIAEDNAPPSLVEAAVDDIFIEGRPDAPEPPKNLSLTPGDNGVNLTWNVSAGASAYKLYLSGQAGHVFAPENYFTTVKDTFLFVPYDQIPYEQFYFQVTAVK